MADSVELRDVVGTESTELTSPANADRLPVFDADEATETLKIKWWDLSDMYTWVKDQLATLWTDYLRFPTWSEVTGKPSTFSPGYSVDTSLSVSGGLVTLPGGDSTDGPPKIYKINVTDDFTLNASSMNHPGPMILVLQVNGTTKTMTLEESAFKYDTVPTMSTSSGVEDIMTGFWDGTHFYIESFVNGVEPNDP